jgi:hypothetical protein
VSRELNVVRAAQVAPPGPEETAWLIDGLWGRGAVGVIGGAPKCGKSWLALEMAVAVASGRAALGRYPVGEPGPALVYAAEDAPVHVRDRIENLARARGADFDSLEVRLILEPQLRLDRVEDQERLKATLETHRPKLLVLDPYVRLQRADENSATEVSGILSTLRELSRNFACAIALVHHARKDAGEDMGQGLRGSSDFHAWGDSNLYVRRRRDGITLSIEHRSAASPPPLLLRLVADQGPVRLEVRDLTPESREVPLGERLLAVLEDGEPHRVEDLRALLKVRKEDLLEALRQLKARGDIRREERGWVRELKDLPVPGTGSL